MDKEYDATFSGFGTSTFEVERNLAKSRKTLIDKLEYNNVSTSFESVDKKFVGIYALDRDLIPPGEEGDMQEVYIFSGKNWKEVKEQAVTRLSLNYRATFQMSQYVKLTPKQKEIHQNK